MTYDDCSAIVNGVAQYLSCKPVRGESNYEQARPPVMGLKPSRCIFSRKVKMVYNLIIIFDAVWTFIIGCLQTQMSLHGFRHKPACN